MNNEEQNNQTPVEELETVTEENNSVKYEQQANELINSVTMADLVDPTVVAQKKKKKGLIVALVVIVLVLGVGSVLLLQSGTYSKIFGITTTSELDVFKTDNRNTTDPINDSDYGSFEKINDTTYLFDIERAGNGVRIKYYLKSNLVAYIQFADDYETTKNFTFNLNNADFYIHDTDPGELTLTVENDYIAFMNSNNQENQVILSKKGIKLEDDPEYNPETISTTKATTTTTTKSMVHKEFNFENTTDINGRTTTVLTEYDPDLTGVDYMWEDEDGNRYVVHMGSEESRRVHPELYTTTVAP